MISRLLHRWRRRERPTSLPARWRRVRAASAGLDALVVEPPAPDNAPVLVLLHGSGHSPAVFAPGGALATCVPADYPAFLVLPDGGSSWYLDSSEAQWETGFLRLLHWVASRYPVSPDRSAWGVCGLSMGGFGAMRLAARHPDRFGSASSILGLLDIEALWPEHRVLARLLGADRRDWAEANPALLAGRLAHTRLLVTTGREAFDRAQNEGFVARCRDLGVPVEYRVLAGGHHVDLVAEALPANLRFHIGVNPSDT